MNCPHCGARLDASPPACPLCGSPLSPAADTAAPDVPGATPPFTGREPSYARAGDLPYFIMAGKWRRWWAYCIDYGVIYLSTAAVYVGLIALGVLSGEASSDAWIYALLLVLGWAYFGSFECTFGATPGKLALRIRVLSERGGRIGFGRATGRYFARFVPFDAIVLLANDQSRSLHDMVAGTIVVPAAEVPDGVLAR